MKYLQKLIVIAGLIGLCCIHANAQTNNLVVSVENSTVHIVVNTDKQIENLAVQVYNKDKNKLCYMMQTSVFSDQTEDGYVYSFDFDMNDGMDTGTYIAAAGGVGLEPVYTSFKFVQADDKISFYNALDAENESSIFEFLKGNEKYLTLDISGYINMEEAVRKQIDKQLVALELKCDVKNLVQVENLFLNCFKELDSMGQVLTATREQWNDRVFTAMANGVLADKYYTKLNPSHVFHAFSSVTTKVVNKKIVSSEFDVACLIAAAEDVDYTTFGQMLEYYDAIGSIPLDKTYWNKLSQEKRIQLWKEMKKTKFTNTDDLSKLFYKISHSLANIDTNSGGTGSGNKPAGGGNLSSSWIDNNPQQVIEEPTETRPVQFVDLEQAVWAQKSIVYLANKGIINGYDGGHFYPNNNITREEFVKIISEAFDLTDDNANCSFSDVGGRWSRKYIASVAQWGIVNGISATEFDPTGMLIRQDMAKIIYKIYSMAGYDENVESAQFEDQGDISNYAETAVNVLYNAGIVNGTGTAFEPNALVTRAQAAKIVYNMLLIEGVKS